MAARELNNFKNELIWNLNVELMNQESFVKRQVDEKADTFLKSICDRVEELNLRLNKCKMTCWYCGLKSTP